MPGVANLIDVNAAKKAATTAAAAATAATAAVILEVAGGEPDRATISAGINIIEQPNFLRFIALEKNSGGGAPPFSIVFDSFLVQRVTRQRTATFDVRYTVGAPVIDVFKDGVELLTINATIPDTAPFYTIGGKVDPAQVAKAQQELAMAQGTDSAGSAALRLARAVNVNVLTGYLGESLEAMKAVYNRYFRASAAVGSNQNIVGIVEFWSKGRVDRGYLVKMAFERSSEQLDHAEVSFDFFVARSAFRAIKKPEVII